MKYTRFFEDQEADRPPHAQFGYGSVISVSGDRCHVKEFDLDLGKEIENTYLITPRTVFEDFDDIGELHEGDFVDIEYIKGRAEKIALTVRLYRLDTEDYSDEFGGDTDSFI